MSRLRPRSATTGLTRSQRLDRLPFTRQHGRLLVGSGVGWALDAMDVGLVSFVLAALAAQWSLSPGQLSAIASIGFVGMAVGASLGGLLADRIGRRQVFALTLLVYGRRHRRVGPGHRGRAAAGAAVPRRSGAGRRAAGRLDPGQRVRPRPDPRPDRGRPGGLLGPGLAAGGGDRLPGRAVVGRTAGGGRSPSAWCRPLYAVVVRWGLPESVRFLERRGRDDGGGGRRPLVRGLGGGRAADRPAGAHAPWSTSRRHRGGTCGHRRTGAARSRCG